MKKMLFAALLLFAMTAAAQTAQTSAQKKVPTNRYAMKLQANDDGTFSLMNEARYAKIVDLKQIPDLLTPYVHENKRLSSRDYKGVEVREVVYKRYDDYELTLSIDMAVSDKPTPVVFYFHGGGWERGNNGALRVQSQYMAKQKNVTGVRVSYTLAPQSNATVKVSIQDVKDAVQYVRDHAEELNIDPARMGFVGNSAGAHLAAVGAMTTPEAKALVGYSGIYDLSSAAITTRAKKEPRVSYFCGKDPKVLHDCSPVNLIPKKRPIAALLFCGTADITVECAQSKAFAEALKAKGSNVELTVYENYDHNLSAKASDKMEEVFFRTMDFLGNNL